MNGKERREGIVNYIRKSEAPVSGTKLAEVFGVSRQVIVQDIALIRASGYEVTSTNKGYVLIAEEKVSRVYYVNHSDDQIEEELNAVVDLGGKVVNVSVDHGVYGEMEAELSISSRRHVTGFIEDMETGKSSPLKNITSDNHAHLIEAESEEILDLIEKRFKEMGILRNN